MYRFSGPDNGPQGVMICKIFGQLIEKQQQKPIDQSRVANFPFCKTPFTFIDMTMKK